MKSCGLLILIYLLSLGCSKGDSGSAATSAANSKPLVALSVSPNSIVLGATLSEAVFVIGGMPPYHYTVGAGQIVNGSDTLGEVFGIYTAPAAAGTDTIVVSDAQGTAVNVPVSIHGATSNLYLWTTVAGAGEAYRFTFDPSSNTFSNLQSVVTPVETVLRGGTVATDESFYVGSAVDFGIQSISPTFTLGSVITVTPAASSLTGVHALCILPNGHFFAGDENDPSTGNIGEFAADGSLVAVVGTVGPPDVPANHPGMTNCHALSNQRVIFVADDTWGGTGGEAVEMDFVNNAWAVAQRVSFADVDTQLGTSTTSPWAMTVHTDGYLYITPGLANGTAIQQMLRCPLTNLTASACATVGTQNLPFGTNWIYGLSQIPGSNDMLVSSSSAIYRYNYAAGTYTNLCDVTSSISTCFLDPNAYIRGFTMR